LWTGKGYVETFNGKLRDELLNGGIFQTLREAVVHRLFRFDRSCWQLKICQAVSSTDLR